MSIIDARARVKARVWQAVAQGQVDLGSVPKQQVEALVDFVTDAALMEVDEELGDTVGRTNDIRVGAPLQGGQEGEKVLWEGRPFLSISVNYIITTERVRIIEGLLGKEREDIELIRIQDLDQKQTLRERMLNVGDVMIKSHDQTHPTIVLNNIKDPQAVHEILRRAVLEARQKYRFTFREEM
jgi:hypothetical protein